MTPALPPPPGRFDLALALLACMAIGWLAGYGLFRFRLWCETRTVTTKDTHSRPASPVVSHASHD
jgi:hypothetical protein